MQDEESLDVRFSGYADIDKKRKRELCGESPSRKLRLKMDEAETKKTMDCTNPYRHSGDYGERVPPVPIPNTEVKPFSADGTWLETARESRSLPDSKKKNP